MTKKEIQKVQSQLLITINNAADPFSIVDLVKRYQQEHKTTSVPEGYVFDAIRMLLDTSSVKLRKDLKIESFSSE